MKKFALIMGGAAALLAVPVLAQRGGERPNPDANGDGVVTRAEVEADVGKRFTRMDVNKDGKLDPTDRAAAEAARGGRGPMRADANGDGAITLAEMRSAAMAKFEKVDADKDGKLTEAERQAMRGGRGKRGGPDGEHGPRPGEG